MTTHKSPTPLSRVRRDAFAALTAALFTLLALTSCLKDQDDNFDQTASERLRSAIDNVQQTLRSAEYGWEFEYYPSSTLAYGGIVYTVKFDSLTATVGCSLLNDSTETTYYRMTNDNGPVLTFDTYNSLLHYFSTPSSGEYEAKGGEFEFVVSQVTDSLITLYGKKTHNTMYLRRLKSSPSEYAQKTINIYDHFVRSFTGTIGGAEVTGAVSLADKSMEVAYKGDTITAHYTYNEEGIRLYQPLRLGGVSMQTFAFDTESLQLTCIDSGAEGITLQGEPLADGVVAFADYAANYLLRYNDNNSSARVTLAPNRLDGTYRLRGLSTHYELVLTYDYETGWLQLGPQTVADYDGNTVYFLTCNYDAGNVWLTENASFTFKWNGSKIYPIFNASPTLPERYNCDTGLFAMLIQNANGTYSAALLSDPDWIINGSPAIYKLNSLQKLRN